MLEKADYRKPCLTPITAELDRYLNTGGTDADPSLTALTRNWLELCQQPQSSTRTCSYQLPNLWLGEILYQLVKNYEGDEMQRRLEAEITSIEIAVRNSMSRSAPTNVAGVERFVSKMLEAGFHVNLSSLYPFLSDEAVAAFLTQYPPTKTFENSPLTPNEALDRYGPKLILSLARNVEGKGWQKRREEFVSSIDPYGTEARPIAIKVVERDHFPTVARVLDQKTARGDSTTGIVYTIPLPPDVVDDTKRVAYLRLLSRILHYLHEVNIYATINYFLKEESKTEGLFGWLFWRGMRKRDPDSYYFGTHSLTEALAWQKASETMNSVLGKRLSLYSKVSNENAPDQPNFFGPRLIDAISERYHGPDYGKPNLHTKRAVKLFLVQSLLQLSDDDLIRYIASHLAHGHIGL